MGASSSSEIEQSFDPKDIEAKLNTIQSLSELEENQKQWLLTEGVAKLKIPMEKVIELRKRLNPCHEDKVYTQILEIYNDETCPPEERRLTLQAVLDRGRVLAESAEGKFHTKLFEMMTAFSSNSLSQMTGKSNR